jgi:hypothetical protein
MPFYEGYKEPLEDGQIDIALIVGDRAGDVAPEVMTYLEGCALRAVTRGGDGQDAGDAEAGARA